MHLGVRDGVEVVYVAKLAGHRQMSGPSRTGGRTRALLHRRRQGTPGARAAGVFEEVVRAGLPRHTPRTITAPGILARQLEQVRLTGVAFEFEESRTGLVCVGAPILDLDGEAVAAVSVAGPVTRFNPQAHADRVRTTARRHLRHPRPTLSPTLSRADRIRVPVTGT